MTETADGRSKAPELEKFEVILLVLAIASAIAVSSLGLYASYSTLSTVASTRWGWGHNSWVLPVGMDLAIPAFTFGGLFMTRFDIPVGLVALFPRALTAATVYLNWSADRTFEGRLGHAVLVSLWVVFSEAAGRIYARFARIDDDTRMERVRRIRWVLAPFSTMSLWRRMQLWEITSYREALSKERNRKLVRAELRERFGRLWRFRTPRMDLVQLRLGELVPANLEPASAEVQANRPNQVPMVPEPPVNQVPNQLAEPQANQVPAGSAEVPNPTPEPTEPTQVNLTRNQPKRPAAKPTPAPAQPTKPAAKPTNPGTASVTEQVRQILDLIEEHGYTKVTLGFVREQTGLSKTTAYNRLVEARATYSETHEQNDGG